MDIIDTPNLNEARKQIAKSKKEGKMVIVKAKESEFNRKILENKDVDVLLSPEIHDRKDMLKQRDSGLNEVLCKIAAKNNISIGINLEEISKMPAKEKAITISRIMQNIRLCKKTDAKISVLPEEKYKKQDILSLFLSLKGSTAMASKAAY
jgi:ribonuclease P/MRP protein subunit RPP1